MARARNLKPSFFTNDILAECSMAARLLFAGLWTIADREGRLEDRPKKIRAEILPYDDCDTDSLLNELSDRNFIIRYNAGENKYIQIVSFVKHQNPHQKEQASTIPAPDKTESRPELAGLNPESPILNPESPILNPESPIPRVEVAQSAPRPRRGKRLKDWLEEVGEDETGQQWGVWAKTDLGLKAETINAEMAKFCDYWNARSTNATKLDWTATWRNWMRRVKEQIDKEEKRNELFRRTKGK